MLDTALMCLKIKCSDNINVDWCFLAQVIVFGRYSVNSYCYIYWVLFLVSGGGAGGAGGCACLRLLPGITTALSWVSSFTSFNKEKRKVVLQIGFICCKYTRRYRHSRKI